MIKKRKKGRYRLIDNQTDKLIGIFPSYKKAWHEVDMLLDGGQFEEIQIVHDATWQEQYNK